MRKGYRKGTYLKSSMMRSARTIDRTMEHSHRSPVNSMGTNNTSSVSGIAIMIFCGFMLAGVFVAFSNDNLLTGILYGLLIWFIGFIVTIIVGVCVSKNEGSSENVPDTNAVVSEPTNGVFLEKNEEIKNMLIEQSSPQEIAINFEDLDIDTKKDILKRAISEVLSKNKAEIEELSIEYIDYLDTIIDYFEVHDFESIDNPIYKQYCQNVTLWKVLHGIIPDNTIDCPINWQKDEHFVWCFTEVVYYEEQVQTIRVGQASGLSIKVAKGVYYKTGVFQSHPVSEYHMQAKGTGAFIITNKNVYFYSLNKSVRFPYSKILAFVPFSDAIGVQPDKENAKTLYFQGLDGTYAYNLVSNIRNIQ